jgi:hypothetical protein
MFILSRITREREEIDSIEKSKTFHDNQRKITLVFFFILFDEK